MFYFMSLLPTGDSTEDVRVRGLPELASVAA